LDPTRFFLALMQLYSRYPFSETGGQRTPARNADVGGVYFSPHLFWVGKDVIFDGKPTPRELNQAATRLGLKIIAEEDHHHIQPADWLPG